MLKKQASVQYQQSITGTWGRFNTPAGAIEFLETKARIGSASTDPETRLTRFLKPVREALNTRDMDFNQLLQRDLDDHRVAKDLVPYLLRPNAMGPAFFPPIVTALLPFDGPKPLDKFPPKTTIDAREDEDAWWLGYAFGEAFKFEKVVNPDGSAYPFKLGKLFWNDEKAQLVVIDGQHRAMALLAIFRTINKQWEGQGDKYKHFYESAVQELIKDMPVEKRDSLFSNIELPVTILWFPDSDGQLVSHQKAARKLFVDVNKNARAPSESRVLLLSDAELCPILTRRVLNEFRSAGAETLPISAIEYDHPERDQASSAKWSAVSNVTIIYGCVYRAVFGPAKYINDLGANFLGKENLAEGAKFMRSTLQLSEIIPSVVDEGDRAIEREKISDAEFPRSYLPAIEKKFMEGWGYLIVKMLSDLAPYRAHGDALKELRDGWSGADSTGRLARDAMFEGVGMYWTLRDSHEYWREKNKIRANSGQTQLNKTDIVYAWEETERKHAEFEAIRAKYFLGSSNEGAVEASKGSFSVFSTHACQLGFVLACRSLAYMAKVEHAKLREFSDLVIAAANAGMAGEAPGLFGRRTFLLRSAPSPLNRIPKLDSPFAVYFRYFWLELLGSKESRAVLGEKFDITVLDEVISSSRLHYYEKLIDVFKKSLKNGHPDWTSDQVQSEAENSTRTELRKALKKWFGIEPPAFDTWLSSALSLGGEVVTVPGEEEGEESGEAGDEGATAPSSVDELLKEAEAEAEDSGQ